ncbi:MAG: pseudouridine-5'-phosphate glycosidase [Caulobacteraceae bacterium]
MNKFIDYINIHDEVIDALRYYKPIVALESTIISHGMPYPENLNTAVELEDIVRANGATPATIAIINGRLKVGLSRAEVEFLATSHDIMKVSSRDIPYAVAMGLSGSTTVAATMIIARYAGISVFATGGVGGVHRGAEKTFDISADLPDLAKTNVAVVCAGVKSILDIGLTLEKLETLGIPVIGYGTNDFPSFYNRKSGFHIDMRADSPLDCARIIKAKWDLDLDGGVIIANPVPEQYETDPEIINDAIEKALFEANKNNIRGKEITPYLLNKVKELTVGESLETNIALVKNNAELASRIAVEYSKLTKE